MFRTISVNRHFREAFGETTTPFELAVTLVCGISLAAVLAVLYPDAFSHLASWRSALTLLLVFDVGSGSVANFTRSTNAFYAARPRLRWGMIASHLHLVVIALLLGRGLAPALAVTVYTIVAAGLVNALAGRRLQSFVASVFVAVGLLWIAAWSGLPPVLKIVSLLFVFKLVMAFAVDHFPVAQALGDSAGHGVAS